MGSTSTAKESKAITPAHATNLSLDDLLAAKKRVYVRNKMKGILAITVYESTGRPTRVNIPKTKHPVCLTDMATPYALENSPNIRQLVANGHIELLDPAAAQKELESPAVRAELEAAKRRIGWQHDGVTAMRNARTQGVRDDDMASTELEKVAAQVLPEQELAKARGSLLNSNPHADIDEKK